MTKDKLTAKRFLLVGLLAFAWKKQQLFMILSFEDAPGLEQNPTFAVDKIEEVQPMIYHKMISART